MFLASRLASPLRRVVFRQVFITEEFAAGKSLLSGEYLLPSGLAINFGVMIGKLKRDQLMGDVMQVGWARA